MRVDIERLDKLMSLAGQLVINKARFRQIGDSLKGMTTFKAVAQSVAGAQHAAMRLASGIEELSGSRRRRHMTLLCGVAHTLLDRARFRARAS